MPNLTDEQIHLLSDALASIEGAFQKTDTGFTIPHAFLKKVAEISRDAGYDPNTPNAFEIDMHVMNLHHPYMPDSSTVSLDRGDVRRAYLHILKNGKSDKTNQQVSPQIIENFENWINSRADNHYTLEQHAIDWPTRNRQNADAKQQPAPKKERKESSSFGDGFKRGFLGGNKDGKSGAAVPPPPPTQAKVTEVKTIKGEENSKEKKR